MTEKPAVSVIMNCLNGEPFLAEAIESVLAQDMQDLEIIFFDNDSTDRSAEIAQSYGRKLRYFKSETTIPLGAARNRAIAEAMGTYIVFLDCDDLWLPAKLGRQVATMEAPSSSARPFGMCYTDAMRIDADGNDLIAYSHERRLSEGDIYIPLIEDCLISMSSCLIEKAVFDRKKGFDERYSYVEDWDLWLRIARDYDVALVPERLTKIRVHRNNQSRNMVAHTAEKQKLLSTLPVRNRAEAVMRRKTLKNLKVRAAIVALLSARDEGPSPLARQVLRTAACCLVTPTASLGLFLKYLTPGTFKIFLIRAATRERPTPHGNFD